MKLPLSVARILRIVVALLFALMLFVAVYSTAFGVVSVLRPKLPTALLLVMAITALVALVCMIALQKTGLTFSDFGFAYANRKYIYAALAIGAALSTCAAFVLSQVVEPGPLAGLAIAPGLLFAYFFIGASVQEELIFRGLLQTIVAARVKIEVTPRFAIVAVALLFAAIHLVVGPVTAFFAFILGFTAGELRARSGSLIPAIVCHALFNAPGVIRSFLQ